MLLEQLHQDYVIVEGVMIRKQIITEGIGRLLLQIAKGFGKLVVRSVAELLSKNAIFGAALTSYHNNPSQGCDALESDMTKQIDALPRNDPNRKKLEKSREQVRAMKQTLQSTGRNFGREAEMELASTVASTECSIKSGNDPVSLLTRSGNASASVTDKLTPYLKGVNKGAAMGRAVKLASKNDPTIFPAWQAAYNRLAKQFGPIMAHALATQEIFNKFALDLADSENPQQVAA